jgi:hypothetical protein
VRDGSNSVNISHVAVAAIPHDTSSVVRLARKRSDNPFSWYDPAKVPESESVVHIPLESHRVHLQIRQQ